MGSGRRLAAACVATVALAAGVVAASVGAAPTASGDIRFGVADDAGKYADDGGASVADTLAGLGMTVQRWTLLFDPANPTAITEQAFVDRALPAATGRGRGVIVALFQRTGAAPDPQAFCAWAATVARRWPTLRRFVIGNEVNATRFWSPQKTAADPDIGPRTYTVLLGECYDALKAVSPQIQVIGYGFAPRAVNQNSTKPLAFLRKSGEIYRASGRTRPLMDAIAVHPYPNPNARPQPAPDRAAYQDPDFFGIPQLDRVKAAIFTAFNGTHQRTTATGLPIVIDEVGYQSDTADSTQYTGDEVSPTVSDAEQATYHARIAALYHCDPTVSDVLYFGLYDERQRNADASSGGWQAGVLRPNGDRKPAYDAVRTAISAGCTGTPVTWTPPSTAVLLAADTAPAGPPTPAAPTTPSTPATAAATAIAPLTDAQRQAAATAAADAALERDLLALQGAFAENHPAAAVDGTAELATFNQVTIEAAARRITDASSILASGAVNIPDVLWRLPLAAREAIAIRVVTLAVPACDWGGTFTNPGGGAERTCIRGDLMAEATFAWEYSFQVDQGLTFCVTVISEYKRYCSRRVLFARRASVKPPPVVVLAEGRGDGKPGATLAVKMKRLRGATVGILQTVFVMQSKADPSKWMSIALRPTVITPSDVAKATKAWKAKQKKAKAKKKKKAKKPAVKKTATAAS